MLNSVVFIQLKCMKRLVALRLEDKMMTMRAASVIPNRVKPKWFPVEVVKETADCRQVKIHYTGYSKHYNEWICKCQIGSMPVSLPREVHYHGRRWSFIYCKIGVTSLSFHRTQ